MNFSQQPPSKQWAALKYRGEKFAEVWFKPEGEPFVVTFRIPQQSFQIPGMGKQLTIENLLKAVAIGPAEIESWRHGDVCHSGMNAGNPELGNALPAPPERIAHLDICVRLHPPREAPLPTVSPTGKGRAVAEIPLEMWQDLEARWKAILGLEAALDALRKSLESLLMELEGSLKKSLTTEEKTHAPRADISQWDRAKNRVHHALPKVKESIHRTIWALGSPERKRLEGLYKDHIQPHVPFPQMDAVLSELENLQKDRQVLAALGQTVYQESKSISAEVQGALRTLQSNAATNAQRKKGEAKGGKFFKSVRKMSGA